MTTTEAEDIADWRAGDILAGDRLVRRHEGLVRAIARQGTRSWCQVDDLAQIARLALLRAARRHDPERAPFPAYAALAMRSAVYRAMLRARHGVTVGHAMRDGASRVAAVSIDGTRLDGRPLHETLAVPDEPTGVDTDAILDALPPAERAVMARLYGPEPETLEQIGASRGVTKQAIHAISSRAMARLRAAAGVIAATAQRT